MCLCHYWSPLPGLYCQESRGCKVMADRPKLRAQVVCVIFCYPKIPNPTRTANSELCLCYKSLVVFSFESSWSGIQSCHLSTFICFGPKSRLGKAERGLGENKTVLPKRNDDINFQWGLCEIWTKLLIVSLVTKYGHKNRKRKKEMFAPLWIRQRTYMGCGKLVAVPRTSDRV